MPDRKIADTHRTCHSSTSCCGSGSEGQERPSDGKSSRQHSPRSSQGDSTHNDCSRQHAAPQSITTLSSRTADESSKDASVISHETNESHLPLTAKSDSGKGWKKLRQGCLTGCCQPHKETACCGLETPPRIHPMDHHSTADHDHDHNHDHDHDTGRHSHDHTHGEHHTHEHACSSEGSSTCCSHTHDQDSLNEGRPVRRVKDDGERGAACYERVVLTVRGLKCGCCETGLSKALHNIPAVVSYQVNIVIARIEFELDTSQLSVPEVIARLKKTTGYNFEQFDQSEGQILELLVQDPETIHRLPKPNGVTLLESETRQHWSPTALFSGRSSPAPGANLNGQGPPFLHTYTLRIHYDAKQVGARDLLEYYRKQAPNQEIQLAPAGEHPSVAVGAKQTKRASLMFLITLAFTIPILVFVWGPVDHDRQDFAHVSLALASIVQIIAVREFVPTAFQSLIHAKRVEMDFLIAMSTSTAYIFSVVVYALKLKGRPLETESFFETSTLLVTLILLGRAVSEFARFRAAKATSIRSLQVHEARLITAHGRTVAGDMAYKIDARLLQYGDEFVVQPHERIVTDGTVVYGGSEVDESMITGESVPVAKGLGHEVHAGTMNGSGQLGVALTKLPHENSISQIAAMVENAELSKPKIQALADKIAGWFVPTIAFAGFSVFMGWLFASRYIHHKSWGNAVVEALTYAIATLIVSCPCAIGLAVPMVVLIAGGTSARFGVVFRDSQKLEVARSTTDVIFDKTGTVTTGELEVVDGHFETSYRDNTERMIMGLLGGDRHPVAAAVMKWLQDEHVRRTGQALEPAKMTDIKNEPGNGVYGFCEDTGAEIRAGNPQWLGVNILESRHTMLCVTVGGVLSATFRLEDRPRPGAHKVISLLASRGITVHMISGDGEGAVNKVAHTLNIPKTQTRWRLKPIEKQRYVHELQKEGKIVLFCGDGTNDSAALRQADVGVHMNQGSDVAKSASDVVLMAVRLQDILVLLDISRAAYRRIIANFAWSFLYNTVAILMASGALRKVRLKPAFAGLGELVSVLPVILVAFQMTWRDYGKKYRSIETE